MMNIAHRRLCTSTRWRRRVELDIVPWTLYGADLGDDVLEIGPGFGATTQVLARERYRLTALEIDQASVDRLSGEFGPAVTMVHGDGTAMPFEDGRFSGVVCFTMLHHVPSAELQDRLFAEVARVLRPGGVFAGSDSQTSATMRLLHLGDTLVPVPEISLPARLAVNGFSDVRVDSRPGRVRFRAVSNPSG